MNEWMDEWMNEWINGEICLADIVLFEIKHVKSIFKNTATVYRWFLLRQGILRIKKREREKGNKSFFLNNSQCTAVVSIEASSLRLWEQTHRFH